jgi:hypothetical protein
MGTNAFLGNSIFCHHGVADVYEYYNAAVAGATPVTLPTLMNRARGWGLVICASKMVHPGSWEYCKPRTMKLFWHCDSVSSRSDEPLQGYAGTLWRSTPTACMSS